LKEWNQSRIFFVYGEKEEEQALRLICDHSETTGQFQQTLFAMQKDPGWGFTKLLGQIRKIFCNFGP